MATASTTTAQASTATRTDFSVSDVLRPLGSLKVTVVLFAVSLILVLVGTLAQDEMNMQDVKERYFLSWIAPLHFDDFFPQAFFPHEQAIPGVLPFPGGALVGVLLMVNLLAAKITRFRMQARGRRLAMGLGFLVAGFVIAGLIVASGHNSDGLQGAPPITYPQLWGVLMGGIAMLAAFCGWAATTANGLSARVTLILVSLVLVGFMVFAIATGYRIGDPGLRIVWQLLKGVGAGAVLLVGCQMLFGRQGGNVLLHLGVGLLMVGQFAFGDRQLEQRLSLVEDQMTNTFVNLDEVELVFLTESQQQQNVIAVPVQRLAAIEGRDTTFDDPALPVRIKVVDFFENSKLIDVEDLDGDNPADQGNGLDFAATELPKSGGANPEMDIPAAYIELLDADGDQSLGTFLVSQQLSDLNMLSPGTTADDLFNEITVDETTYKFGLRLHREVKPYWVKLEDVRRVNYSGTETPRDYSSFIRIVDPETGEDRRERVWMNNPLRYRGETFFQSSYTTLRNGKELTGIQVVRNSGWLIPYVACSIIALGMAAHFWGTLVRFVRRRRREESRKLADADPFDDALQGDDATTVSPKRTGVKPWPTYVALAAVGLFAVACLIPGSLIQNALRPAERDQSVDYFALGKMPVQYGGRVMPLDAYARQTVKAMTNKESIPVKDRKEVPLKGVPGQIAAKVDGKKMSALQWLMEVAIDNPNLYDLPMFRIDADEVLAELGGLDRRPTKLYSYDEIDRNRGEVRKQVEVAFSKQQDDPQSLTFKEKKLIELELRKRRFLTTAVAFRKPTIRPIPEEALPEGITKEMAELFAVRQLQDQMRSIRQMNAPRVIPPGSGQAADAIDQPDWDAYSPVAFDDMVAKATATDQSNQPVADAFSGLIDAYESGDPIAINESIDAALAGVVAYPIPGYVSGRVWVERWMNAAHPNSISIALYILALVLVLGHFAFGGDRLRKVAWGTVLISFLVHTLVLAARVYVTGRAPVINLYSSAVFVGWGAVLFGLVIERVFRYGTGTFMAAIAGATTLQVAYGLTLNPGQGDTMPVLQAVLDTQFWLSTHVISVALGYVATMVAGVLGIAYLIAGWIGKGPATLKELYRSVYGATCLGILFSTIGTILGGLWADDSWGRFWGWDPKENGALLIVIWNALMLHARWDKMVAGRGFSVLAIAGNIITAWSWFGTNELGIGLHSYGFTEGTMFWLTMFFVSQLAFIAAGIAYWPSSKTAND
ncbi:cytochrome c biogenesis protein [Crateriforma conspicua]|uniref:Cytochrome c biogenesis protein CcsA n=1 Tax=Crateriforma conspicua TaxID=2527996 RepID=A0A5C5Y7A9_9PLAN|nr:cytochrome c biogenesis protein CcsA [Crateriforma conspicua]TWT71074.1 Cytochrome c biogenesis protein CcsA [Crateriforma conspicua]